LGLVFVFCCARADLLPNSGPVATAAPTKTAFFKNARRPLSATMRRSSSRTVSSFDVMGLASSSVSSFATFSLQIDASKVTVANPYE
jgi:hypothetical protein